jgi:hypothetical protein
MKNVMFLSANANETQGNSRLLTLSSPSSSSLTDWLADWQLLERFTSSIIGHLCHVMFFFTCNWDFYDTTFILLQLESMYVRTSNLYVHLTRMV